MQRSHRNLREFSLKGQPTLLLLYFCAAAWSTQGAALVAIRGRKATRDRGGGKVTGASAPETV